MKTKERILARELRANEGLALRAIAERVGVARSTASLWVRDIELTPAQQATLAVQNRRFGAQNRGAAVNAERGRKRRAADQLVGRHLARQGEVLFVAGAMLYWGEGDKNSLHVARMTNTDPAMLVMFLRFIRTYWQVDSSHLSIRVSLFADDDTLSQNDQERYWLDVLDLPATALQQSTVNTYSRASKRKRVGRLPYGTCRLSAHSTTVVQGIYGAIQELGGFERPEWLGGASYVPSAEKCW